MQYFLKTVVAATLLSACEPANNKQQTHAIDDLLSLTNCLPDGLAASLNHVQSIGSHNSYKKAIPEAELGMLRLTAKDAADALDYSHLPLSEQLDLGMRQLELDVFYDPDGGMYAEPLFPRLASSSFDADPFDSTEFERPGFKTMHVQDVDVRSHCPLFTNCLEQINQWSLQNPKHTPLLILINAKQAEIDLPDAQIPLSFNAEAFMKLDTEIQSVLDRDRIITPDDVRGGAPTLRQAIMERGWPTLAEARGKLMFALDESPEVVDVYKRGKNSLQSLVMFVNSGDETADHAAYFTLNDPVEDYHLIRELVQSGFLVRTRADADTKEARSGDTSRRDAALGSGAQYVSTDFYLPRPEFSDYQVALPSNNAARCRPKSAPP